MVHHEMFCHATSFIQVMQNEQIVSLLFFFTLSHFLLDIPKLYHNCFISHGTFQKMYNWFDVSDFFLLYILQDLQHDSELKDISGKSLPAIDVFAMSIQYLRDHLVQTLNERGTLADLSQIMFVLTVPAIWTESAKLFMQKAAVNVNF